MNNITDTERNHINHLQFPDGKTVTILGKGNDEWGTFLRIKHKVPLQGAMNSPHWHPILTEFFEVEQGSIKCIVDGVEKVFGSGERLTIYPKQTHQFFNIGPETLIGIHEIRPPGFHWEMFLLHHKLECEGKLSRKGIAYNPLWLGMLWKYGDGYAVGAPAIVQKVVFGGLARIAETLGYHVLYKGVTGK